MIQIPLIADVYFQAGETPVLEFQDVREAELFIKHVQRYIDAKRGRKKQRLEFFTDGIYFDGKLLELRPKYILILRAFEFVDRLSRVDFILRVWNDPLTRDGTVRSTISTFNKELIDRGIFISTQGDFYELNRP